MATYVERTWAPADEGGLSRRDRQPGVYQAYVPDELGVALPRLGSEAESAAADALAVLARADERIGVAGRYLNHLLIRSESISSSWIEGNRVTPKKLAIAEILQHGSRTALDVVANVRATEGAISDLSDRNRPITTSDIEELQHTIEPRLPRGLRTEQNWVGGQGWSPLRADFVPPPEAEVPRLSGDLARFVTATEGNPIVRAAIAHAQFETIHPFIDGNGRTGRALIHTVLRRADAVRNTLIPISAVFAGSTDDYIRGLTAFRATPPRLDEWIIGFSIAAETAAQLAVTLAESVDRVRRENYRAFPRYREERGLNPVRPRAGAVSVRILESLPSVPVTTAESVVERFAVSPAAAHRALTELAEAEILGRTKDQRGRLVCWSADSYLALVALTERSGRVGGADTRERSPRRGPPAPARERTGPPTPLHHKKPLSLRLTKDGR